MFVSQLNLFPVKAMQPVLVDHAVCEVRGFRGDRRFMVVDDTGKFLTQRHDPLLGTITAHVTPNGLTLSVADHAHLAVAFPDLTPSRHTRSRSPMRGCAMF